MTSITITLRLFGRRTFGRVSIQIHTIFKWSKSIRYLDRALISRDGKCIDVDLWQRFLDGH